MAQIFDWEFYVNNYEDLRKNGINTYEKALKHWNTYGKYEGRLSCNNDEVKKIKKDVVIFCMARYEKEYIKEFIQYHLFLGFDHIYLYDDEDVPIYKDLLDPSWPVTIIPIILIKENASQRTKMLNHFFRNYKNKHFWAACIDVDEFIVLKKHDNIHDFLNEYIPNNGGIGINWVLFGSNGHKVYTDKPVLERFIKCGNPNQHIKTIFVCKDAIEMSNPHFVSRYRFGHTKSTNNIKIPNAFNTNPDMSICQINHYHTKSEEEYAQKQKRGSGIGIAGRGLINPKHYGKEQFNAHDQNIHTDTFALDFYNKKKESKLSQ
jgi:hypothetical protein